MAKELGITIKKEDDTAEWYEQVVLKSNIADFGEVSGTIVIKPKGYYVWQQIQNMFNDIIENEFGVENMSFPLLIPERFFKKEAEHAEGFAPELAWVTSSNQTQAEEKAIIRPTSETIISDNFRKWVRNYKDLPVKVNQWCNVFRWEVKQTKLFLRGREFHWQEGHCIYEEKESCMNDVLGIIDAYKRVCEELLALPLLVGEKTPAERFAGAESTYAIEALMPDGKALQCGTSHYLGQGFMKAFGVEYTGADQQQHTPHYNSWGFSTRLLGGLIMTHSDDRGLVLPPKLVKEKIVIVPAFKKDNKEEIESYANDIQQELEEYKARVDAREGYSLGFRIGDAELGGTPITLIVGGKEKEEGVVTYKCRDLDEKVTIKKEDFINQVDDILDQMHNRLFEKAKQHLDNSIVEVSSLDELKSVVKEGKLALAYFSCEKEDEKAFEDQTGIGTRCIYSGEVEPGTCVFTQKPADKKVYFGRSY